VERRPFVGDFTEALLQWLRPAARSLTYLSLAALLSAIHHSIGVVVVCALC
jgi:hypothetical protein